MEPRNLFTEDRAVSPVVGVALLIAIAVILAAVIGAVVLGLGTTGADTPQAQLNANLTGSQVTLDHQGGDKLPGNQIVIINRNTGNETALGTDLSAGRSATVPLNHSAGDEIAVVWQDPDSDSETVLETFTYDP
jgi:flagellin-like protein